MKNHEKIIIIFLVIALVIASIGAFTVNYGMMMLSFPVGFIGLLVGEIVEEVSKKIARK